MLCGFTNKESCQYLEEADTPLEQILPLTLINPNCWVALSNLEIDTEPIKVIYECPYTKYTSYSIVPVALVSTDLKGKWESIIRKGISLHTVEYLLDYEFHKNMWQKRILELTDIGKLLMGSGYTYLAGWNDGYGSKESFKINLDNGDFLWVYAWEWYNK